MIDMIYLLLILGLGIIVIGFYHKDFPISALGSMFIIMLGIYIAQYGLADSSDWLTQSLAAIIIGLGMYILGRGSFELLKEKK